MSCILFFTASKVKLNILNEVICFANTKCCLNENKLDHAGIKIYTGGILLSSVENNVLVTANGSYSNSNNTELSMAYGIIVTVHNTEREREREREREKPRNAYTKHKHKIPHSVVCFLTTD